MSVYNSIGQSYATSRLPDARIVDYLLNLLQIPRGSIIADLGAGTGGYSNAIANQGFSVYAVEPSSVMQLQAIPHPQVRWCTGYAENIPLPNKSVDAVISILAIHHFSNLEKAFNEMNRIARKAIIILTFAPQVGEFWLYDYFPFIWEYDKRFFPPLESIVDLIQKTTQRIVNISPLQLPPDLSDMFLAAGWRHPEIYLNPRIRAGLSAFALADSDVETGVKLLQADLTSGKWNAKYGKIQQLNQYDVGYRFLHLQLTN